MSARAWDVILLAAALLCAAGFARFYVRGVLEGDRTIARAAAVGFLVIGACAVIVLLRLLL